MQLTLPTGTRHPPIHIVAPVLAEVVVLMLADKVNVWIAAVKALDILVDVAAMHQAEAAAVPAWLTVQAVAAQAAPAE
jgi:hypothetical protein